MPLYRYKCRGCGHTFKQLHKSGDDGRMPTCPECGSSQVERLMSKGVGIRFKGNGFYRTDYQNSDEGGAKKGTDTESGEGSEATQSEGTSS